MPIPPPPPTLPPRRSVAAQQLQAAAAAASPTPAADAVRVGSWLTIPVSLLASLITAVVTHWASPATLPPNDEARSQIREIAADVRELKHDARDARDRLAVEQSYTRRNLPVMAAVIEHGCSAKFAWQDGRRPADPDWLPPPLNGAYPQWQPAVALLPPPIE